MPLARRCNVEPQLASAWTPQYLHVPYARPRQQPAGLLSSRSAGSYANLTASYPAISTNSDQTYEVDTAVSRTTPALHFHQREHVYCLKYNKSICQILGFGKSLLLREQSNGVHEICAEGEILLQVLVTTDQMSLVSTYSLIQTYLMYIMYLV